MGEQCPDNCSSGCICFVASPGTGNWLLFFERLNVPKPLFEIWKGLRVEIMVVWSYVDLEGNPSC